MLERARVRCSVCRSTVAIEGLWAAGTCARCSQPLHAARRRPEPGGVLGATVALLHPGPPPRVVRAGAGKQ
jgi:hypothetical protein